MGTAAIGIICKAPKPGRTKTRLVPRLGPERAAALARAFLIDLATTIDGAAAVADCQGYAGLPAPTAPRLSSQRFCPLRSIMSC